jgi:hypothetical protein
MGDGPQTRIHRALEVANEFGQDDGARHKAWVIDQMVRALCGQRPGYDEPTEEYRNWVREYCDGEDGPDTYEWDEGIAP